MASIIRQIVSGPRAQHPEAGLDLCYVTDFILVTSGPSSVWPRKAYRNPVDQLVAFLDKKHGDEWAIFEFRAEGTGYPDEEVYGRVHHFPWPDHHPPPFSIIPNLMAAMRNWLHAKENRVAVVHCKAGKGRSGTVATSYLISQEGWRMEDALKRFTTRRMRAGFGEGVSIPSQLRWVRYVNQWTNSMGKKYIERPIEIVELHIWGLRTGVKVSIEGYVHEGKRIRNFHTFVREEKVTVDGSFNETNPNPPSKANTETLVSPTTSAAVAPKTDDKESDDDVAENVILRPSKPIALETSDVNVDFERRNKSSYTGFAMVTSIAHVWFNTFFEGGYQGNESGVFEIEWEAMDGIKGSAQKGIKALDRLKVVWKYSDSGKTEVVDEPPQGAAVREGSPVDWRGEGDPEKEIEAKRSDGLDSGHSGGTALTLGEMSKEAIKKLTGRDLGLRASTSESVNVSRASSVRDQDVNPHESAKEDEVSQLDLEGVQSHVDHDGATTLKDQPINESHDHERQDTTAGKYLEAGIAKVSGLLGRSNSKKK